MTTEEIIGMCKKLAGKYRTPQHTQDLESEGVLKCLELLAEDKHTHPAKLWREANRSMHDYVNLKTKALSFPASDTARGISRGLDSSNSSHSESNKEWMALMLNGGMVEYSDHMAMTEDHAIQFEKDDYFSYINSLMVEVLTADELHMVHSILTKGMTLAEFGSSVGVTRQRIAQRLQSAMVKLSSHLEDKL